MRRSTGAGIVALIGLLCLGARCDRDGAAPCNVYLTWQGDTSTTMTVVFHSLDAPQGAPVVYFDEVARGLDTSAYARSTTGNSVRMPSDTDERYVHTVELTGLSPGTTHYFVATYSDVSDTNLGTLSSGVGQFRTIPSSDEPIRFITGGDMDTHLATRDLLERARETAPMFGVIGGDIAYANGERRNFGRWDTWLGMWEEIMVTDAGNMIPLVMGIGNHEVDGGYGGTLDDAPFYVNYFPQDEGRTYFARTFGANVVVYVLDTGHVAPHSGEQADWLRDAMTTHTGVAHQFAVYHVPLYPSHREFLNLRSLFGRATWGPIFDEFGLDTAFENHDHTVKRTKRIRGGAEDATGTLYLGDGCFGQFAREVSEANRSYLDFAESIRHFWLVEVDGVTASYSAIDRNGEVVDSVATAD